LILTPLGRPFSRTVQKIIWFIMANELEIYKILVGIDSVLVAATITAYSIATSLHSFEVRLREQAVSFERKLDERIASGELKGYLDVVRELRKLDEKSRDIMIMKASLSLVRIVLAPDLLFFFSMGTAIWGILSYPDVSLINWKLPAVCLGGGVFLLLFALSDIEWSKRRAITALERAK